MALPKDPRQKMINFMYLVLTAMLALNVSAEILNAFDIVNNSILTSNKVVEEKNDRTYKIFAKQLADDPEKVGPFKKKADNVKVAADSMFNYLEGMKSDLVRLSGGLNDEGELKNKAEPNVVSQLMLTEKKGYELKSKLEALRKVLLTNVPADKIQEFSRTLPLNIELPKEASKGIEKKDWPTYHFSDVPVIAGITLLSKFQNDIRNSETMIVEDLLNQVHADDFKFDQLKGFVSLNSKNLMSGQKVEAQIMIGAYSSTVTPEIIVNGAPIDVKDGIGTYSSIVSGLGPKTISGIIRLQGPNGKMIEQPFSETYNVGASATSISADKMNVFYIGLQNPLTITAAGYPAEAINATITDGGSLQKTSAGHYIATVRKSGTVKVNVTATQNGETKSIASQEFRVKYMPDPVLKVGMSKGPSMKAADFKVQQGLRADLENFVFDGVRFDIVRYTMSIDAKGRDMVEETASSPYFPPKLSGSIRSLKPGDFVYFDNISVKGPDGIVRDLPSVTFKIN